MNEQKGNRVFKQIQTIFKKDITVSFEDETCYFSIDAISKKEIANLKKSFDEAEVSIINENNKILVILYFDYQG